MVNTGMHSATTRAVKSHITICVKEGTCWDAFCFLREPETVGLCKTS